MHEHAKHIVGSIISGGSLFGAVTVKEANEWAFLTCSVLGSISAALTIASIIYSFAKKRHHRK